MKRFIIGFAGVILLAAAAVLIAPSFVDWNRYKGAIADRIESAIGRGVVIGGDLRIALLPRPALVAEDLRVANVAGHPLPNMLRLERAEIRLAAGALFGGRVAFEDVLLVEPVILIEVLADGRLNWDLKDPAATAPSPSPNGAETGPRIQFDSFRIENGAILFRSAPGEAFERIDGLHATIEARSLQGPVSASGHFRYAEEPFDFELAVGLIRPRDPVALRLALADQSGAFGELAGSVAGITGAPRLQGRLEGGCARLSVCLTERVVLPAEGFLEQPLTFTASLSASAAGMEMDDVIVNFGETRAAGTIGLTLDPAPRARIGLRATQLDLDAWLAMPAPADGRQRGATRAAAQTAGTSDSQPPPPTSSASAPSTAQARARFEASFALSVDALTYRNGIVRQVEAAGMANAGEISIESLTALLPGGTAFSLSGTGALGGSIAPGGTAGTPGPNFRGSVTVRSDDLRGALRWLDADMALRDLPRHYLRSLAITAVLEANGDGLAARNLTAQLDGSAITGSIEYAAAKSPPLSMDLAADRFNADGLLPALIGQPAAAPPLPKRAAGSDSAPTTGAAPSPAAVPPQPMAADVQLRVEDLSYRGARASGLVVDGRFGRDQALLRRLSVADIAGASGWISGAVHRTERGLAAYTLNFDFEVSDPARLLPVFSVPVPRVARTIGTIAASGRLAGNADRADISLTLGAAGGVLTAAGVVTAITDAPTFAGTAALAHDDLARLVNALGGDYTPRGPIDATDLNASIAADTAAVVLENIEGQLAGINVGGSLSVDGFASRPSFAANLVTGPADAGRLYPDRGLAHADPAAPSPLAPAARPSASPAAGAHPRWPRAPVDLSVLGVADGRLKIRSEAFEVEPVRLESASLDAHIANGELTVVALKGRLFGGALAASGRLSANAAAAKMDAWFSLTEADLGLAAPALLSAALNSEPAISGSGDFDMRLSTSGSSEAEWVQRLNGSSRFELTDVAVAGGGAGSPDPLVRLLAALQDVGALVTPDSEAASAQLSASFAITNGIARTDDLALRYGWGTGSAAGHLDLPAWTVDAAGVIQITPESWARFFGDFGGGAGAGEIGFSIRGPIDGADVRVKTDALSAVVPLRGTGDMQRGLGRLLESVLPRLGN